jgi:hypothetical protein
VADPPYCCPVCELTCRVNLSAVCTAIYQTLLSCPDKRAVSRGKSFTHGRFYSARHSCSSHRPQGINMSHCILNYFFSILTMPTFILAFSYYISLGVKRLWVIYSTFFVFRFFLNNLTNQFRKQLVKNVWFLQIFFLKRNFAKIFFVIWFNYPILIHDCFLIVKSKSWIWKEILA